MKVKSKVWLEEGGKLVFGDGKSQILNAIDQTGSISKASKKMGVSFRRGWGYVTAIEKRLGCKLIERERGGRYKGGSHLTPYAKTLLSKFNKLKKAVNDTTDKRFTEIFCAEGRDTKDKRKRKTISE